MRKLFALLTFALLPVGAATAQPFCPGVSPWVFDDVQASDPFCGFITWMAQQNVTLGCLTIDANHRLYCPDGLVTRKQMAAFMKRLGDAVLPLTCAAGQVMKWNGTAWACANDNIGGSGGGGHGDQRAGGHRAAGQPEPDHGGGVAQPRAELPAAAGVQNGQVPKSNGAAAGRAAPTTTGSGHGDERHRGHGAHGRARSRRAGRSPRTRAYLQSRVIGTCAGGVEHPRHRRRRHRHLPDRQRGTGERVRAGRQRVRGDGGAGHHRQQRARPAGQRRAGDALRAERDQPERDRRQSGEQRDGGRARRDDRRRRRARRRHRSDLRFESPNRVTDAYGTVGGGYANRAGDDAGPTFDDAFATVGGGYAQYRGRLCEHGRRRGRQHRGRELGRGRRRRRQHRERRLQHRRRGVPQHRERITQHHPWRRFQSCAGLVQLRRRYARQGTSRPFVRVGRQHRRGHDQHRRRRLRGLRTNGHQDVRRCSRQRRLHADQWRQRLGLRERPRRSSRTWSPSTARRCWNSVAALPIARAGSSRACPGTAHMGPMAQDFHAAFGWATTRQGSRRWTCRASRWRRSRG